MDWKLKQKQSLPLEAKIILAQRRIKEWYEAMDGMVYVAFSGGKDSTVLLHLVRSIYSDVPAVFADTGLEWPEIRDFVKTIDNVVWVKPKLSFDKVIEKYGYPVISKNVSGRVERIRNTNNDELKNLYLHGGKSPFTGKEVSKATTLSKKWHFLVNAPFKISERCCDVLKKDPLKRYAKEAGRTPFIGILASESSKREREYFKHGCNVYGGGSPQSKPLSVWCEEDIWSYIRQEGLDYAKIYDKGATRTGCIFCLFGCMHDKGRFDPMKELHPNLYKYCMEKLELKKVIEYIEKGG